MGVVFDACARVMLRPWQWGAADCCTAACDVFRDLHGVDPMAPLRGRYSSRMGAMRLVAQEGGWLAMAGRLAARAGLVECDSVPGAIGVVRDAQGKLALGICAEAGWVGKSERGLASVQIVRAWRCRR